MTDGSVVLGIGLGAALAVAERLALSPMARVTFEFRLSGGLSTTVMGELPFTIFMGRDKYLEPYVSAGVVIDPIVFSTGPAFALASGCRLGILF